MKEKISSLKGKLSHLASNPKISRGRLHTETIDPTRTPFQRDRDRIIHSSAFRRLKYKTQVFVYHEGDNYRTRLSHSLEVSQIARSISRFLGLNEDLTETLALAHDLGHTCFGHAGEDALKECMKFYRGFDHNVQTFRIVTELEHPYPKFDGLNLTWETLEGLAKHNGPQLDINIDQRIQLTFSNYSKKHDLELSKFASTEAQIAAISDDIAYNAHDIDDGLRASLFSLDDLFSVPLIGPIAQSVEEEYPNIDQPRRVHELVRRLIKEMVNDVIRETVKKNNEYSLLDKDKVHELGKPLVGFSNEISDDEIKLKSFLLKNMYRHDKVINMTNHASVVVKDLFEYFFDNPSHISDDLNIPINYENDFDKASLVSDYISLMTDRFALMKHKRIFEKKEKA